MRAEEIFHQALTRPQDERPAFLAAACAGDEPLQQRVEALLQAHENPGSFLVDQPPPATTNEPVTEHLTTVIGPYKLLEPIGQGGMGAVWMAEQTEPIHRRVAVKVVKEGMDSRQVLARFEAERQALALMDHPNIAKVLDAGKTPSGQPYFVMELVKGQPITKYCDEKRLGVRERLELFSDVCRAVQHAHQKGIIHRDIKPSNVLVAPFDGKPVVKVIDFGVAKATGQRLTDKTMFTGFGALVGTPEYMSPEQAEVNNQDIDTRSDIYSLGVLLYELLTGSTPVTRKRIREAELLEVLRVIREEDPPRPSTRLSTTEELPSIAAMRGLEPKKLSGLMRGELDWIVMKALEKDRGRRYETANGLARDIQRYLADEAVEACAPRARYKLRKFARKHHKALVTAGAFIVLLAAAAVVSTWQAVRAMKAEAAANTSAQQARDEANAKTAALAAEKQALAAEQRARADETKARQQAFDALRSMTDEVVQKKFTQGTVLTEDDRAFLRGIIAQYDAFAAIKGGDDDSRAVRAIGRLRVGNIRFTLGELKEAEDDFNQALSLFSQLAADLPTDSALRSVVRERLADCRNNRGNLLSDTGRLQEGESDYTGALSIYQQLAAEFPSNPEFRHKLAGMHGNRALVLRDTGRLLEAEKDYAQAVTIQKQLATDFPARPEFRQALANSLDNRANLLSATGRPQEAEIDFGQALSIQKQLVDDFPARPDFRQNLAKSHGNRGNLLRDMRQLREAEHEYDEAARIYQHLAAEFPTQPEYRHELAMCHMNRGILFLGANRLPEAEKDFEQGLSILKQLVAAFPNHPEFRRELANSLSNRGIVRSDTGRLPEAEKDYDQALSILRQLAADFANQSDIRNCTAATCVNLALLQQAQGNLPSAKRLLLEGRPHHLAALKASPRHPTYRQFYRNNLRALAQVHAGLLEQADAARIAQVRQNLSWDAPEDAYDAARILSHCIPIVAAHDKLDDKQRKEAAQFYGDAAMKLLRDAVNKGFKDVPSLKKDAALDPLRQREDLQKLIAELEGKEPEDGGR